MSADEYEVGYGKPPRHAQFRQGNPGGPGRPKGSSLPRYLLSILEEAREGGTVGELTATVRARGDRTGRPRRAGRGARGDVMRRPGHGREAAGCGVGEAQAEG